MALYMPNGGILPPGPEPAPSNFIVPRVVHLASGALPGGGAFTSQAYTPVPAGTIRVSYWISYERGAAGGFPAFHHQYTNGTDTDVFESILNQASFVAPPGQPFGQISFYQAEFLGPPPAAAGIIIYELTFQIPSATTGVRLLAAERGVPATPGTIFIALTGSNP